LRNLSDARDIDAEVLAAHFPVCYLLDRDDTGVIHGTMRLLRLHHGRRLLHERFFFYD
jgi:hypothetical protein